LRTRPQPVTIAVVSLALLSLLSLISPVVTSPFLQTDYPTIVHFLAIALGVLGLLAAGGLWMLRRWALLLTIIVSVLNILLAAPWIAVESQATGKLLAGVTAAGFALILFLVMQQNSWRAFAAGSRVSGVGEFRNPDPERVPKDNGANGSGSHGNERLSDGGSGSR
jgi:peptidoglycan/LPS O-acetylase OafA/YrhL